MTAVIRRADAVLHADIRIRSSIRLSFTSLHPDWMMNTSSSRTDSKILTLISPQENLPTVQGVRGTPNLIVGKWPRLWHGWLRNGILQLTARPPLLRALDDYCLMISVGQDQSVQTIIQKVRTRKKSNGISVKHSSLTTKLCHERNNDKS